jgi:hypothetical protein
MGTVWRTAASLSLRETRPAPCLEQSPATGGPALAAGLDLHGRAATGVGGAPGFSRGRAGAPPPGAPPGVPSPPAPPAALARAYVSGHRPETFSLVSSAIPTPTLTSRSPRPLTRSSPNPGHPRALQTLHIFEGSILAQKFPGKIGPDRVIELFPIWELISDQVGSSDAHLGPKISRELLINF